jgi:hypothetical protein
MYAMYGKFFKNNQVQVRLFSFHRKRKIVVLQFRKRNEEDKMENHLAHFFIVNFLFSFFFQSIVIPSINETTGSF